MKIVVTGALGHIGSKLIRELPNYFEDLELSLRWKRLCGPLFQVSSTSLCHLERQSMNVVESDLKEWRARFNALCAMRLCPELSEGIHP